MSKKILGAIYFVPTTASITNRVETTLADDKAALLKKKSEVQHDYISTEILSIEIDKIKNYVESIEKFSLSGDVNAAKALIAMKKMELDALLAKIEADKKVVDVMDINIREREKQLIADFSNESRATSCRFSDIEIGGSHSRFEIDGKIVNLPDGEFFIDGVLVNIYSMLPLGEHIYVGKDTKYEGIRSLNGVGEKITVDCFDQYRIVFIDSDGNRCSSPIDSWTVIDDSGYYEAVSRSGKVYKFWTTGLAW